MRLSVKGLALAGGTIWAMAIVWTWILAHFLDLRAPFVVVNQLYLGWFNEGWSGLGLGIGIGFIDGAIAGLIFAWLYNCFSGAGRQDGQDAEQQPGPSGPLT